MIQVGILVAHFRGAVVDEGDVVDVGRRHGGDGERRRVGLDERRWQTGNAFLVDRRRRRRRLNELRRGGAAGRQGRRGRIRRHVRATALRGEWTVSTGSGIHRRRRRRRKRRRRSAHRR